MVQKEKKKVKRSANKKNELMKTKILTFLFNLLFYVSMIFIIFGAGMMAILQQQDKSFNGYRMFGVLTNSMVSPGNKLKEGGFRAGDILILKEVETKDLKVGDVITYRPSTNPDSKSTNYLTHRVVKIEKGKKSKGEEGYYFTTRGDANTTDDMPMNEKALVGKVVGKVPKLGGVITYVKENLILSIVFIASVVGFVWVIKMYIISGEEAELEQKKVEKIKTVEKSPKKKPKKTKSKSSSKSKSKSNSGKKKSKGQSDREESKNRKKSSSSYSPSGKKKKKKDKK
ncbi:signal peptidase I [Vagococcus carniphilus]|uniref:signal peptidase I n=1 Tax=Vagococcus carniphilus TaxID=218144 RepID=UPI003BAB9CFD